MDLVGPVALAARERMSADLAGRQFPGARARRRRDHGVSSARGSDRKAEGADLLADRSLTSRHCHCGLPTEPHVTGAGLCLWRAPARPWGDGTAGPAARRNERLRGLARGPNESVGFACGLNV